MIKNNFEADIFFLCKNEGKRLGDLAKEVGISNGALSMRCRSKVIVKGFEEIVNALGYDIEVSYVKR